MKMMEVTQEGRSLVLEMRMAGVKGQKTTESDNKLLNRADQMIQESSQQQAKPKQKEL